jgi:hypothetical protein
MGQTPVTYEIWVITKGEKTASKMFSYSRRDWAEAIKRDLESNSIYRKIEIREVRGTDPKF